MSGSSFIHTIIRVFLLIFVTGLAITVLLTARQYSIDSSATQAAMISLRIDDFFEQNPQLDPLLFSEADLEKIIRTPIIAGDPLGVIVVIKNLGTNAQTSEIRYNERALVNLAASAFKSNWRLQTVYRFVVWNNENYVVEIKVLSQVQ